MPPGIDPLSEKNLDLSPEEVHRKPELVRKTHYAGTYLFVHRCLSTVPPREESRKSRTFFIRSMGRKGLGMKS